MKPKKPTMRLTTISSIIELSPHLRRIVLSGESLSDFPAGLEGSYVKVVFQEHGKSEKTMRSYTIRAFNPSTLELALDFVINRHKGPATDWAKNATVGDTVNIAGPGPLKLTNYSHYSYLLVGDLTSVNAINGYIPRFKPEANIKAIVSVPSRTDIINMDYDDAVNTQWFIEDENKLSLERIVLETAQSMPKDTKVFLGLEASIIRALRPQLEQDIGFDRLNVTAVGYWKQGLDADRFGAHKKANPL